MFLPFFLSFCGAPKRYYNVEIICPESPVVVVRYTNLEEVRQAILRADEEKRVEGTSIGYTAIKFPDKRSVRIEKIAPEQMVRCALREEEIRRPSKNYINSIH